MKKHEIRKLSAVTSTQVVPLGTRWRDDEQLPDHLRRRAKVSDELFISKSGVVVASDLRVGFLAERIETMCISHSNGYARWIIVAIYFDDIEHRFAVRATATLSRPRPEPWRDRLDLSYVRRTFAQERIPRACL